MVLIQRDGDDTSALRARMRETVQRTRLAHVEMETDSLALLGRDMLKVGQKAPDFELPDAEMEMVGLRDFHGRKNLVLYFYPRNGTPSCTIQGIDFSELEEQFAKHDTVVFGISRDDCLSHASFRDKHGLTVQLLADSEGEVCSLYGVLEERTVDGRTKLAVDPRTFIIDKQGTLKHILKVATARGHAQQVLKLVRETG